ncbi:MAG: Ada metal-binding domain-containing protein, partial [Pyrinomonadaceae bacterium]
FLLGEVWGAFGIGPVVGMLISFFVVFAIFMFYGLFRAIYEAETASGAATAAAAAGASTLPPSQGGTALNSAGTRAFFGAQGATNAPPLFSNRQQQQGATPAHAAAAAPRPVVGNRSLAIYHLPDCAWADKIARQNRVEFDSPAVAHSAGFRPCRVCKP